MEVVVVVAVDIVVVILVVVVVVSSTCSRVALIDLPLSPSLMIIEL